MELVYSGINIPCGIPDYFCTKEGRNTEVIY